MALYLTEQDVARLLTMPEAIEAVDGAFGRQAMGEVINQPRRRLNVPQGTYHTMAAADLGLELFGMKAYTSFRPRARFLVLLYSAESGDLLAMIEADRLGQMRTGAASGVATRYLARQRPLMNVGIFGTGRQAETQLTAICSVRKVQRVTVYSRDAGHRADFCALMEPRLGAEVVAAERPEQAAEGQDIVITATTAREPVLMGAWLSPGTHINAVGSNLLMKREVDEETVQRAALLVVDSVEQARTEAGDLLAPYERRLFRWEEVVELAQIVGNAHPGRTDADQITLFKSNGIALEDVAVAAVVYRKALTEGTGVDLPMWQE